MILGSEGFGVVTPDRAAFLEEARSWSVIPVTRSLLADTWTPVTAFRLLAAREANACLLESVEGGEREGRYSFLGRRPFLILEARGQTLRASGEDASHVAVPAGSMPLDVLRPILAAYRSPARDGLPPFLSGAVGYFGYDTVRWIERLPDFGRSAAPEADMTLLFLSETAAFDHARRRLTLTANARIHAGEDPSRAYDDAVARLDALEAALAAPIPPLVPGTSPVAEASSGPSHDEAEFCRKVVTAKEWIAAGDIFQVVLSRRASVPCSASDLSVYRALRAVNPSPYMFLLRFDGWSAVGSSPEPLLRVTGDTLVYRPIAGTAPRGADAAEDAARAHALENDPKERAEHVMLVDLGRNDLGRCAVPGTVRVEELMTLERYSHVMHLVSGLRARLRPDLSPLDALFACFPAGTVSGAPKVRAMEIIEELETERRGIYGGAVGYLDFSGNLDTCIALRTLVLRQGIARLQAGSGIVADSVPEREFAETTAKMEALRSAMQFASRLEDAR
jgi:anthranilate synthase component I